MVKLMDMGFYRKPRTRPRPRRWGAAALLEIEPAVEERELLVQPSWVEA
jgi:hypothetical protein